MARSVRWLQAMRVLTAASVIAVATGCAATAPGRDAATTPSAPASSAQGNAAPGAPADETPASSRQLVDTANLTTQAAQQGFKTEIRDGEVVYCRMHSDVNSRVPSRQCLNEDDLRATLQAEQQQRDEVRRMNSSPVCSPGPGC